MCLLKLIVHSSFTQLWNIKQKVSLTWKASCKNPKLSTSDLNLLHFSYEKEISKLETLKPSGLLLSHRPIKYTKNTW